MAEMHSFPSLWGKSWIDPKTHCWRDRAVWEHSNVFQKVKCPGGGNEAPLDGDMEILSLPAGELFTSSHVTSGAVEGGVS